MKLAIVAGSCGAPPNACVTLREDFVRAVEILGEIGYDDLLTVEIPSQPDAFRGATRTSAYLAPLLGRRQAA
ncbi:MAG: hypothetical protein ACLQVN_06715 [Bryobacteraceae bacterium]